VAGSKKADDPGKMTRVAEGIYRRGDTKSGVLIARVWDPSKNGNGGKVNITLQIAEFETYKEAVAAAKDAKLREEDRIRAKSRAGNREETVASWAKRWQDVVPRTRRESTRAHNEERIKAFVADFGDRKLREVAAVRDQCHMWIVGGPALDSLADVARGWTGVVEEEDGVVVVPSHRGNLPAVRAMFTDAQSVGLVDGNPFAKMGLEQSQGRRKIRVLTAKELTELVALAGQVHGLYGRHVFGPLIQVAAWTGLRPGELFALFPEDVDLVNKRIKVERAINAKSKGDEYTKTEGRDDAPVPLLPEAEEAFRHLDIDQLERGRPIFRTTHGKPYTQRNQHYYWDPVRNAFAATRPPEHWLSKRIERLGKKGNLDFYELRHFFGSRLGEKGVSPYDIARAMGHQDGGKLAMERYIHTDAEDAADRVLNAFRRVA
jgi:integrase